MSNLNQQLDIPKTGSEGGTKVPKVAQIKIKPNVTGDVRIDDVALVFNEDFSSFPYTVVVTFGEEAGGMNLESTAHICKRDEKIKGEVVYQEQTKGNVIVYCKQPIDLRSHISIETVTKALKVKFLDKNQKSKPPVDTQENININAIKKWVYKSTTGESCEKKSK